ncbi:MAG TPA: hypothetical protein VGQ87_00025 [Patescibacteria group bacterium]|jgi:hypothetical protein|nr:hypothetical protein [Patescibacteria group bacterium]
MFEQINEPVEVGVLFKQGKTLPVKFFWQGREYLIKTVNLSYSAWEGRTKFYYFAVSDSVNYFKLKFDTQNLNWTLLESYVD